MLAASAQLNGTLRFNFEAWNNTLRPDIIGVRTAQYS